jgi:hypothetical protein
MTKLLIIAALACVAGFGVGYATGWHHRIDDPELAIRSQMRETVVSENFATSLSLVVLLRLEQGELEKAKSLLAEQIATYQHSWSEYDGVLPRMAKLLPVIQETSGHSETLRQKLAQKPAPSPTPRPSN